LSAQDTSGDQEVTVHKDSSEALRKGLSALSPEDREIVDLCLLPPESVEEGA
jgi:RNA polymerase sigma-70 factor, ECF subfamily